MFLAKISCAVLTLNNAAVSWYLSGNAAYDTYNSYDGSGNGSYATLSAPEFVIFASCWTLLFVLYLFFTSATAYTRTNKPIGRFFNRKIVVAVDGLCAVFWFAGFIVLALFYQALGSCQSLGPGVCGTVITSIFLGVCTLYDCCSSFPLKDESY